MGSLLLRDVLMHPARFRRDDTLFMEDGCAVALETPVDVVPFGQVEGRVRGSKRYLIEAGVMAEVIADYEQWLGRPLSPTERVRALRIYIERDAFAASLDEILDR